MNRFCYIAAFLLASMLFVACGGDKEVQMVDLESMLPQSEQRISVKDTIISQEIELDTFSAIWLELIPDLKLIEVPGPTHYFPDRFNFQARNQLVGEFNGQNYHITTWEFKDSIQLMNAFFNWLDCFGPDCKSLKVGEQLSIDSDLAMAVWVGGRKLIYLTSNESIKQVFWQALIDKYAKNQWNFHFVQQKRRKTMWLMPNKEF